MYYNLSGVFARQLNQIKIWQNFLKYYFNESIKYYTKVDDNEVKSKIIYAKYEIAKLLFVEKKFKLYKKTN